MPNLKAKELVDLLDSTTKQQFFSIVKIILFRISHNFRHSTVKVTSVVHQAMAVLEPRAIAHQLMEEPMVKLISQTNKLPFHNWAKQLVH